MQTFNITTRRIHTFHSAGVETDSKDQVSKSGHGCLDICLEYTTDLEEHFLSSNFAILRPLSRYLFCTQGTNAGSGAEILANFSCKKISKIKKGITDPHWCYPRLVASLEFFKRFHIRDNEKIIVKPFYCDSLSQDFNMQIPVIQNLVIISSSFSEKNPTTSVKDAESEDIYPNIKQTSSSQDHDSGNGYENENSNQDSIQMIHKSLVGKLVYRDIWIEGHYIADCKPFIFGVVSPESNITVIPESDMSQTLNNTILPKVSPVKKLDGVIGLNNRNDFITRALIDVDSKGALKNTVELTLMPISSNMIPFIYASQNHKNKQFPATTSSPSKLDLLSVAVVTYKTLADKFACNSQSWISLEFEHFNHANGNIEIRKRYIYLCCIDGMGVSHTDDEIILKNDQLYVSDYLYYQITKQQLPLKEEFSVKVSTTEEPFNSIPLAKDVIISPIVSPNHFSEQSSSGEGGGDDKNTAGVFNFPSSCLKSYFDVPRILCEGDIFAVYHLNSEYNNFEELNDIDFLNRDILSHKFDPVHEHYSYFKVMEIKSNQHHVSPIACAVVSKNSSLVSRGDTSSYLPTFNPFAYLQSLAYQEMIQRYTLGEEEKYHKDDTYTSCDHQTFWIDDQVTFLENYKSFYDMVSWYISCASGKGKKIITSGSKKKLPQKQVPILSLLLHGNKGSGKRTICRKVVQEFGLHLVEINCFELVAETDANTEENIRQIFIVAQHCLPCMVLFKNFEAFCQEDGHIPVHMKVSKVRLIRAISEELQSYRKKASTAASNSGNWLPMIVVASIEKLDKMSTLFRSSNIFVEKIECKASLEESERYNILEYTFGSTTTKIGNNPKVHREMLLSRDISIKDVARQLTGCTFADIRKFVLNVQFNASNRLENCAIPILNHNDHFKLDQSFAICRDDIDYGLSMFKQDMSRAIGAPQVPSVQWQDIGGLENAKQEVLDTIQLPLQQPELFSSGGVSLKPRSGILLFGPPGTGKTLLAKAVATECQLNFLSVKGPELINMYVGESERNIREVFSRARQAKPCVIFFDELDALAPNRGVDGDSGGVMDRVVSQLLAELDGVSSGGGGKPELFVIGATNRPDLIDSALLRPGRFDRMVYLGTPQSEEDVLKVLKAQTRRFTFDKDVDLQAVVKALYEQDSYDTSCLTGADLYSLSSDALMNAIMRYTSPAEDGSESSSPLDDKQQQKKQVKIVVKQEDFIKAVAVLTPSISAEDLKRYKSQHMASAK